MRNSWILLLVFLLGLQSCKEDLATPFDQNDASDYSANVAIQWVTLQRDMVKSTAGFTPPVAARAYAYAALALYESVVPGMRNNISYKTSIQGYDGAGLPVKDDGKQYNWEISANAAMAAMMRNLFKTATAEKLATVDALEEKLLDEANESDPETVQRSIDFGKTVADAVYQYSKSDQQDQAYLTNFPDYTIPDVPGKWEPTAPNQKPLQPFWGNVRTFLSADGNNNLFVQPTSFSTDSKSVFYLEANEVYITSLNLSDEQKTIAQFWSDDPGLTGTPPGHSMSIATIVLSNENADLGFAAEVLSKVGLAVHDAFVSCWKCKYTFHLLRPITYIKKYIDANYTTLLATPPFPEHTSGHSVQTAASMAVLEHYFGNYYDIVDITHNNRTDITFNPRSFSSFQELANEAAISRLYGGIHYRPAIDLGIKQGRQIGRNIALIKLEK